MSTSSQILEEKTKLFTILAKEEQKNAVREKGGEQ